MAALAVVSRLNRKIMLVTSMLVMGICHITLAICFHVQPEVYGTGNSLGGAASIPNLAPENNSTNEVLLSTTTANPVPVVEVTNENYDHRPAVLGWLPLVAVILFLFMGNIGYGTLIWVVTGRHFSVNQFVMKKVILVIDQKLTFFVKYG